MAALAVLGYSVANVVDLVCNVTLLAVCLLDEILVDLTCKLYLFDKILVDVGWSVSYATSRSSAGRDSWPVSYATSRSSAGRGSCQPGMRATLLAAHLLDEVLVNLAY